MSEYAFEWVADAGVKWQPRLLHGRRRWTYRIREDLGSDSLTTKVTWAYDRDGSTPTLYRSRRRAERVARREQKRRDCKIANIYREAEEDSD